jgi:large subunit ribosomal protein L4
MKCKVIKLDNSDAGEIDLDDAVFGVPVRQDLLARMVNYQLAKRRQGTHKSKTRGEINKTTRKMYKQKGTGRARHGAASATQFRGGAKPFGPKPRDHAIGLPKKVRQLGLKIALSSKLADGKLVVLDQASLEQPKTKQLAERVRDFGWSSVLLVDGPAFDHNLERAARNLVGVQLLPAIGANVYDILRRDVLILTKAAVQQLEERLA